MAKAIQLVYNLQAFGNTASPVSNGLEWKPTIPGLLRTDGVEASADLINSGEKVKKIAISCEPGEQWIFNEATTITVGRSGIYELDDKVEINHLTYVPRQAYVLNEEATTDKITEGKDALVAADLKYTNSLESLNNKDADYYEKKQAILDIYVQEHSDALKIYTEGLSGIYDFETYIEPKNIVINYIYETEEGDSQ